MRKPLPPLTALRAFEAAARHLSLKRAAEELNVTPAAISNQVQLLESVLNTQLFRRGHRSVALTDIAQVLAPKLHEAFDSLEAAMDVVQRRQGADVLSITSAPSFASLWLMPRLHHFMEAHPEVDVHVSTRMRQFSRVLLGPRGDVKSVSQWAEESDAVIAVGYGDYPGLQVDCLLPLSITPLCSPRLLQAGELRTPSDLRHAVLLHDDRGMIYAGRSFWDIWLEVAGVSGLDAESGPRISHAALVLEAAIAGRGVVASTIELVGSALTSGQLAAPFDLRVPWALSYHLVMGRVAARRPIVQRFREWILESAKGNAG